MPEAVDDRALVPAVLRMGDERGELGEALLARLGGIDLTELRIRPGGHGRLAGRDVAADEFHGPVRVDGGEAVGVAQLPAVGEAVVTRGALHVDAEERLRDALRELQLGDLARAHRAAPDDALGEAFAIGGRRHEFAREAVIRFVREQGEVEPVGDLLATTVDIPGAGVIITQQVVPEDHPVVGVIDVTGEERADERLALVGTGIGREGAGFFGGRQQADEIQHDAALEGGVVRRRRGRRTLGRKPAVEHAVERMRASGFRLGQHGLARAQRRLEGWLLEGEPFGPDGTLLHPGAERGDLGGADARTFRRHTFVGIGADDGGEQASLRRLTRKEHRAVLAAFEQRGTGVHREAALLLVAGVALAAVLPQDRHHLMGEVDRRRPEGGRQEETGEQRTTHQQEGLRGRRRPRQRPGLRPPAWCR